MQHIHLATGLARRGSALLLVGSNYPSQARPLWNLPGGRQIARELLTQTLVREVAEETGLHAIVGGLAYISESYDGDRHFVNTTFHINVDGTQRAPVRGDHIAGIAWVAPAELDSYAMADVARSPLVAYLLGDLESRYAGFHNAGISITWADEP